MRSFLISLLLTGGCAATLGDGDTHANELNETTTHRLVVDGQRLADPITKESVVLRGVNMSANAKTPPFLPFANMDEQAIAHHLDQLGAAGINSLRLTFFWEAYEPERGAFDDAYLEAFAKIAEIASRKHFYVIADMHQDLFSRHVGKGCGSGFPRWTVPERFRASAPLNPGAGCGPEWGNEVLSSTVTGAFKSFYENEGGVRDAYLEVVKRLMTKLAPIEGVLGLDPLNEPVYEVHTDLGGEDGSQLMHLYRDAAFAARQPFPSAIMFLEGHIWTNNGSVFVPLGPLPAIGMPVTLPTPSFGNVVYAPHVYHGETLRNHAFDVGNRANVFSQELANMTGVANAWKVPLWIGEFGIFADTKNAPEFFDTFYGRMNNALASGAMWNDNPEWGKANVAGDGWNSEDFSLFDGKNDAVRSFYRASAYAERVSGKGVVQRDEQTDRRVLTVEATANGPGKTVIFVPGAATVSSDGVLCNPGHAMTGGRAVVCAVDGTNHYAIRIVY